MTEITDFETGVDSFAEDGTEGYRAYIDDGEYAVTVRVTRVDDTTVTIRRRHWAVALVEDVDETTLDIGMETSIEEVVDDRVHELDESDLRAARRTFDVLE